MNLTRRDTLLASASVPIAAAVQRAPLTKEELRILAMTSTPSEAWTGREEDYDATRIADDETMLIVDRLETMGLIEAHSTGWGTLSRYFVPTEAGYRELQKAGVEA